MGTINDEWSRYLTGLGYSGTVDAMLRSALQDNATSTSTAVPDLWYSFLTEQGLKGTLQDMMYSFLESKGYTGTLNDKWMQAVQNDDVFGGVTPPDPACIITLTHDDLDAFGLAPMDVSGQTVSVTADGVSNYGMSSGLAGKPVDWAGVRVVAKKNITNSALGHVILHLVKPDSLLAARIIWSQVEGQWQVEMRNLASDTRTGFVRVGGSVTDRAALGVDGETGDVTVYLNGTPVVDKNTPAAEGSFSGLGGMFATGNVSILDIAWELGNGDTYSAEIITQYDKYEDTYPAGTKDWCGEDLPFTPAPSCAITLTGDIAPGVDPLDISGQTVSKSVSFSATKQEFYAGGPAVPLWAEGTRAIGYQASQFTEADGVNLETKQTLILASDDFSEDISLDFGADRQPAYANCWAIYPTGMSPAYLTEHTDSLSKVALLVDSGGDVQVVIDGDVYDKSTFQALAGVFTKPLFLLASFSHLGDPTVYEADV